MCALYTANTTFYGVYKLDQRSELDPVVVQPLAFYGPLTPQNRNAVLQAATEKCNGAPAAQVYVVRWHAIPSHHRIIEVWNTLFHHFAPTATAVHPGYHLRNPTPFYAHG